MFGSVAGPWCKAKAVDAAVRCTSAPVLVVADADCWTDKIVEAVAAVEAGAPWATPHDYVDRWTEARTDAFWRGETVRGREEHHPAVLGGGIVIVRRDVWFDIPIDPRFTGWGHEDHSWGLALSCLLGDPVRLVGDLTHFWHPPQPRYTRRVGSEPGRLLERRYWNARNDQTAMRALVDEAREAMWTRPDS